MSSSIGFEGILWKKGKIRGSYKRRYFRLVGQTMSYSDGPSLAAKSKGYIDLSGNGILRAAPDPGKYRKAGSFFLYALELEMDRRTWVLIPESEHDRDQWVDALVRALRPEQVSGPLLAASRERTAPAAPAPAATSRGAGSSSRRGAGEDRDSKRRYTPVSSEEEGEGAAPGEENPWRGGGTGGGTGGGSAAPAPAASAPRGNSGFFGRKAGPLTVEMTTPSPSEAALREEIERLKQENAELAAPAKYGKVGAGKGLGKPLLSDNDSGTESEEDEGPSCCSRCCTFIKKNIALIILLVIDLVILAMGAAIVATGIWLLKNLGGSHKLPVYLVMGSGGVVILLAVLCVLGALCRHRAWGRCMMYILCIVLGLVIALEAAAVGFLYKYSGKLEGSSLLADFVDFVHKECCVLDGKCSWLWDVLGKSQEATACATYLEKGGVLQTQAIVYLRSHLTKVAECTLGAIVVEIAGIVSACYIAFLGRVAARKLRKSRASSARKGRSAAASINSRKPSRSTSGAAGRKASKRRSDSDSE